MHRTISRGNYIKLIKCVVFYLKRAYNVKTYNNTPTLQFLFPIVFNFSYL